ncbi:hypothetical protein [Rhodopirellula sp. P2]|uniref:hypothetical protein n=1 Tax=Rhodopirellula sp. P2 TaxID=2127060 RepID=UPI0023687DBD|nr:hypothetical protein [Rhodopirellula sp. P2]WDQ18326.1 hypothetical protein PSR62_07210 [Rhodopirellula sp. P2]
MKFCLSKLACFAVLLTVATVGGCQGSSEPAATSTDELTQFLNDNPDLKEPKEDVPASDPSKP